jgi:uncharacterized protein YyaL (SSP411 family)
VLAVRNGEFLFRELVRDDHVLRSYKNGSAKIPGFLEDYAAVALGALALGAAASVAAVEMGRRAAPPAAPTSAASQDGTGSPFPDTAGDPVTND